MDYATVQMNLHMAMPTMKIVLAPLELYAKITFVILMQFFMNKLKLGSVKTVFLKVPILYAFLLKQQFQGTRVVGTHLYL